LLWLGKLPEPKVIILGLITTFAGYTAVYSLNDVIDWRVDREKLEKGGFRDLGSYLDAVIVRHPMAQGLLSFKEGLLWTVAWALLALIGAYLLNPVCMIIFIASASFLIGLFLWLFFWEIGGQNIPADWTDIEEDRSLQARTIPVRFGPARASSIVFVSLVLTLLMNVVLLQLARVTFELPFVVISFVVGFYFLLIPAHRLYKTRERMYASVLFNRASYYPIALLGVVTIKMLF
jgi:4-hydroxybenzoate polyprenyltransferase